MGEKHLSDAGIKGNLSSMEPEDSQGFGYSGSGQQDVSASQHGYEDIHGFMEGALIEDNKDEGSISQDCNDVHEQKGMESQVW